MSTVQRYEIEAQEHWRDFCDMPFIDLRQGYQIRILPPFGGAMYRFCILHTTSGKEYSIYFDAHEALGIYGKPYCEVYPIGDDTYRSDNIYDILREIYCDAENETAIRDVYPEWFI